MYIKKQQNGVHNVFSLTDEFQQLLAISQGTHLSSTSIDDDLTTVAETSEPSSSQYEDEDEDEDEEEDDDDDDDDDDYDDNFPPRIPNRKSCIRSLPSLKEDSDCKSDDSLHTGDDPLYAVIKE